MASVDTLNKSLAGLPEALHAARPAPQYADKLMLFGQFVGSWSIEYADAGTGGSPVRAQGELHFGWVLGGRAIQDTWIVPGRHTPTDEPIRPFHGTTVRFYDPRIDAWRSTWIEPINGRGRRFIGRPKDGEIVLLSAEEQPWLRWRFTNIKPDAAVWLGEMSHDNGETWVLEEEMRLSRVRAWALVPTPSGKPHRPADSVS